MRTGLTKFQWCPWCGDFMIHGALKQALKELQIPKHKLVFVTGIGCNSKMNHYTDGFGVETLHGRWIPFATWVKLANPDLVVISLSWDGDTYGIGIGHLLHAVRRNINIVHIVADNENYALTTWQASATTPIDIKTKSTPYGNPYPALHPVELLKATGCEFVESVSSNEIKQLKETIKSAILHQWFSLVNVKQACPSWKNW